VVGIGHSIPVVKGWGAKELGFSFQQGQESFLFFTSPRLVVELTQPPIQRIPDSFFQVAKWMWHDVYHPSPSCAETENVRSYTSTYIVCPHVPDML
jgi:hypothetical protein